MQHAWLIFYGQGPVGWQPHIDAKVAELESQGYTIIKIEITNPNPFRLQHQPIHHANIYYE